MNTGSLIQPFTPIIESLAWTLAHFLWQGAALAGAFAVVTRGLREQSAAARYLVGCGTLALMALTPVLTFAHLWNVAAVGTVQDASSPLNAFDSSHSPALGVGIVVVTAWALGVAACLIWVLGGWIDAQRVRHLPAIPLRADIQHRLQKLAECMGVRCAVRVVEHASIVAPLTLGAIRPVVFIPACMLTGLSRGQLQAIIAHELAHIRRMDYLVNLLQALLEAILFYHPAVWWVSARVRQEREYCCDDLAAKICGNTVTYARALAQLESLRSDGPRLGLSSQGGSLMKRIARLLDRPAPRLARASDAFDHARRAAWSVTAACGLLIVGSGAVALVQPPAPIEVEPAVAQSAKPVEDAGAWLVVEGQPATALREIDSDEPVTFEWRADLQAVGDVQLREAASGYLQLHSNEITVQGRYLDAVSLRFAPAIDPEHMPSEGLMKAAQLAYPFNLLQLMPWVAPEAHEVLVKPTFEPPIGHTSLVLHAQALVLERTPHMAGRVRMLRDVPLAHVAECENVDGVLLLEAALADETVQGQWTEVAPQTMEQSRSLEQPAGGVVKYLPMQTVQGVPLPPVESSEEPAPEQP